MNFKLEFKNYKSFKTKQSIEFKPITILIGPNSAGKSSIMKLLAFLKQSMENSQNDILSWRKPLVDMKGYDKVAHRGNGKPIEVGITATVGPAMLKTTDARTGEAINIDEIFSKYKDRKNETRCLAINLKIHSDQEISGEIGENSNRSYHYAARMQGDAESELMGETIHIHPPKSTENIYASYLRKALKYQAERLESQNIRLPQNENIGRLIERFLQLRLGGMSHCSGFVPKNFGHSALYTFLNFGGPKIPYVGEGHDSPVSNVDIKSHFDKLLSLSNPNNEKDLDVIENHLENYCGVLVRNAGNELKDNELQANIELVDLREKAEKMFEPFEFFPPLRPEPRTFYTKSELVEITGSGKFDQPEYSKFVNIYLAILGFETELIFELVSESEELYKITIKDLNTGYESSLADVGYGYSQVLPIIFAKTRVRKTVCLEQPELHLHPKSQGALADLIVNDVLATSEKNEGALDPALSAISKLYGDAKWHVSNGRSFLSNNYIIETHSEHLLRGLQLKVAEGVLSSEDIAIYYISRNKVGNGTVEALKIEKNGFFEKPIPAGFYDSTTQLLEKLWEAQG